MIQRHSSHYLSHRFILIILPSDLLSAIQSRVPGLKIPYYFDGGLIKKFLVFNGPKSFGASQECLVEVDNIVLVPFDGQSVADQLYECL